MKKILTLLFFLIATASIGQYPINQILSSDSTMVSVGRNATGGIRGGLVNMVFTDTTAANLSRISYYTGAQIWTTTDSAIWVRFKGTPSFWVKMAGASGGTTGSFWNITGNYFGGGVPLNYGVGTNSYDYLPLKTNNITRLLIPPDGILRSSAPANKYLMMDTTTLEMYYGDGGGGSGWSLTGNSGTTSSNFIGTTDDQPLSFRVNNRWAGRLTTSGNIFWGDSAGVNNIGYSNVAIGRGALRSDVGGINLVAIGDSALYNNLGDVGAEEGLQNTAVGSKALYSNTTGSYNTANGHQSLYSNTTGSNNTANGLQSLYSNTTGSNNTANGYYSLYSNTTGSNNTANGYYSLYSNTTGSNNTANGLQPLYSNTTGSNNTTNGYQSLYSNTTGSDNTANGYWSLYSNTTGYSNTANGLQSLYNNTTGYSNTANGYRSLYNNTTGYSNTANGLQSLYYNTTGNSNTANGLQSLYYNTTGNSNTVNGYYSLFSNTTGGSNTANGAYSLSFNTTGSNNTANGTYSLYSNTTGDNNVGIGYQSGSNAKQKVDAKNQILIGANTYGTRDSIAVIGASFMKETILRGKLIDSTLSAGAGTKAVRWNSSTGEFTYADTTVGGGGGSPAGSNKQVQYNNSGSFGGATGFEVGNTNNRVFIQSQSTTEVPLIAQAAASQTANTLEIKNSGGTVMAKVDNEGTGTFNGVSIGKYGGAKGFQTTSDLYFVTSSTLLRFDANNASMTLQIAGAGAYTERATKYGGNFSYERMGTNLSLFGSAGNTGIGAGGTENLLYIKSTGEVGAGTTSPVSKLESAASFGAAITTTSSNITLDATHHTVIITSGTPTVTLPAASSSNVRRIYVVVNQTGSAVTISSYKDYDGSNATTIQANSSIEIQSNGTNWYRVLGQKVLSGSSTYTPTTSGLTNVDSTHVFECQYSWITDATTGLKTVTVSGQVEVYINSANTDSRVILSLPVASSFANEYEAGGSGGVTSASNGLSNHRYSIGVKANTISEAAEFVFNPTSGSCNAKINFSFHYKVNTP